MGLVQTAQACSRENNKHRTPATITHLSTGLLQTAQANSRENSRAEAMGYLDAGFDRLATGRRDQPGTGVGRDRRRRGT